MKINNFADLEVAIEQTYASAQENVTITLESDISISSPLTVPTPKKKGVTLTIQSNLSTDVKTLKRGSDVRDDLITVNDSACLILKDINIAGDKNVSGALVHIKRGGVLTLTNGAMLHDNVNKGDGGGVVVDSGAKFIMNSGIIKDNIGKGANGGGGLFIDTGAYFEMNGGIITGNNAANTHLGAGGGVFSKGIMTMTDGIISGNTGFTFGGGVLINEGTFTMNGGIIKNNSTAATYGSGGGLCGEVFRDNERFNRIEIIMNNGEISGNNSYYGGGASMNTSNDQNTSFTMNGGVIKNNTAFDGAGMYVYFSKFYMNGGTICQNTADGSGGGVNVCTAKMNMNGGKIQENNAARCGGGVFINGDCVISGGEITKNTSKGNGGGMYQYSYNPLLLGGSTKIKDNNKKTDSNMSVDNLFLYSISMIALGNGKNGCPVPSGMEVWTQIERRDCILIKSDASETDTRFFRSDDPKKTVYYDSHGSMILLKDKTT